MSQSSFYNEFRFIIIENHRNSHHLLASRWKNGEIDILKYDGENIGQFQGNINELYDQYIEESEQTLKEYKEQIYRFLNTSSHEEYIYSCRFIDQNTELLTLSKSLPSLSNVQETFVGLNFQILSSSSLPSSIMTLIVSLHHHYQSNQRKCVFFENNISVLQDKLKKLETEYQKMSHQYIQEIRNQEQELLSKFLEKKKKIFELQNQISSHPPTYNLSQSISSPLNHPESPSFPQSPRSPRVIEESNPFSTLPLLPAVITLKSSSIQPGKKSIRKRPRPRR